MWLAFCLVFFFLRCLIEWPRQWIDGMRELLSPFGYIYLPLCFTRSRVIKNKTKTENEQVLFLLFCFFFFGGEITFTTKHVPRMDGTFRVEYYICVQSFRRTIRLPSHISRVPFFQGAKTLAVNGGTTTRRSGENVAARSYSPLVKSNTGER